MKFKHLTIKELRDYFDTGEYRRTKTLAITRQRIFSHIYNPRASVEDISLILALQEDGDIVGFIGLLPDTLYHPEAKKVYWISCWWSHPEKGKSVGVPLLLAAYQATGGFLVADASPDTLAVFQKTKLFSIPPPKAGLKVFLEPSLKNVLIRKKPGLKKWSQGLLFLDKMMGICFLPFRAARKYLTSSDEIEGRRLTTLSEIEIHYKPDPQNYFLRSAPEFSWIISYPWVLSSKDYNEKIFYPFSSTAHVFQPHIYALYLAGTPIAFLFLTERDGVVKLGYMQCKQVHIEAVAKWIFAFLVRKEAKEFVTFEKGVMEAYQKLRLPFCYKHPTWYQYVWGKPMGDLRMDGFSYGDGDAIFT